MPRLEGVSQEQFVQHLYPQVSPFSTTWAAPDWFLETQGMGRRQRAAEEGWLALWRGERTHGGEEWLICGVLQREQLRVCGEPGDSGEPSARSGLLTAKSGLSGTLGRSFRYRGNEGSSPPPPHLVSGFLKFRGGFTAPPVSPFELLDSEEQFFTALSPRGSRGNPSGSFRRSRILTNLGSSSGAGSSRVCSSNLCSFRENSRGKY